MIPILLVSHEIGSSPLVVVFRIAVGEPQGQKPAASQVVLRRSCGYLPRSRADFRSPAGGTASSRDGMDGSGDAPEFSRADLPHAHRGTCRRPAPRIPSIAHCQVVRCRKNSRCSTVCLLRCELALSSCHQHCVVPAKPDATMMPSGSRSQRSASFAKVFGDGFIRAEGPF